MSQAPRISLEQWRALQAVVEAGGYAQAAERVHKTQSTITYAVQQIQKLRGIPLMPVRMIPVASPAHPLHALGRELTDRDLKRHRRILMRDTSMQRAPEVAGVELRWTVSNKATQIRALTMGLGFAWMPEET